MYDIHESWSTFACVMTHSNEGNTTQSQGYTGGPAFHVTTWMRHAPHTKESWCTQTRSQFTHTNTTQACTGGHTLYVTIWLNIISLSRKPSKWWSHFIHTITTQEFSCLSCDCGCHRPIIKRCNPMIKRRGTLAAMPFLWLWQSRTASFRPLSPRSHRWQRRRRQW